MADKPITVQHLLDNFEDIKPETPICESCFHILTESEDEDGVYLACSNEMCLEYTQYYI